MNPTEVVKLLGQPEKVDAGSITYWIYVKTPYGNMESYVTFINSKVSGWLEPDF